ncbi:MAG: ATP-dependent RecD-like DNA helicase [Gammaproteobacteria bacterium]
MYPIEVAKPLEELSGIIERITFYNESNGFCVLKIHPTNNKQGGLITVIGSACNVTVGEYVHCKGNWVKNNTHGLQFHAKILTLTTPNTLIGIEKYLSSGLIKGVGPSFAKRMVSTLGAKVFEIIETDPNKLLEVPGIGAKRYQKIIAALDSQKEVRKIVVFLHEHGIGTARAVKIYKTYKEQAITKIKENPYRLALEIHGIGFKIADGLALSLGIPKDSVIRAEAGIRFILQQFVTDGNCAMGLSDLISAAEQQLTIPVEVINNAVEREMLAKRIVLSSDQTLIYLKHMHTAECYIAKQIFLLSQIKPYWHNLIDLEQEIINIEKYSKIKFSNSQLLAIKTAIVHKIIIITGGPGVGKTTVAKTILHIIANKTNKILLCAPTGKAAKRLSESTNMPAITLHRMLAFDPKANKFKYNEDNLLDVKLVLVDEVSMIDLLMFSNLLKALPLECALILMGDADQLPSVGSGAILADLMGSDCIRTVKLQEIFRQSATSQIIINAHRINNSCLPFLENQSNNEKQDFYFIKLQNPNDLPNKLLQVIERIEQKFAFKFKQDIQILSPMNKGLAGVISLNNLLQKKFNINSQNSKNLVTRFGNDFAIGDKIIQLINNYDKEVFNGDIGIIDSIDFEDTSLLINFDGRLINYDFDELDEISLAYAITIHKSQGSEYPVIIIPICLQHYNLLQKNLIYTGVTRGKKLVILIGELKALAIAVKNVNCKQRITTLKDRIKEKFTESFNI